MRHLRRSPLACLILLAMFVLESGAPAAARGRVGSAAELFSAARYADDVRYLASDELAGRLPGTPGIEAAAEFIARQFKEIGLRPAGVDGTWYQPFTVSMGKLLVDDAAVLRIPESDAAWQVRRDWIPLPFTGLEDVTAPVAFAGYGISAEDEGYDDYADFDATGKILLIFRYEPLTDDPDAEFGGREPSRHALFRRKADVAARHGAKALLIVNPPDYPGAEPGLYAFNPWATQATFALPLVHVTPEVANALLKRGHLPDVVTLAKQIAEKWQAPVQDLGFELTLHTGVKLNEPETRNVIGVLPGDGTSDEYVVVGGHYDHLGLTPDRMSTDPTPLIHNGADDNASGTAGVIELARALAKSEPYHRNILFITFSGEELGLLGSQQFVKAPTIPLDRVRAMFNFDMIGRFAQDRFTIYGIPSATEFADLVAAAAQAYEIQYHAAEGISGNSDHWSFYRKEIPYLFAFTGVHKDYHRPTDDVDLIDADGAVRLLAMFHDVIGQVADLPAGPTFQQQRRQRERDETKPAIEHEQDAHANGEAATTRPSDRDEEEMRTRPKVRLGIMPDVSGGSGDGLVAVSVTPNEAAAQAGMKDDDRIIKIGEYVVKDIYDYMAALKNFKPGDTVPVVVVRGEEELTLQVKLGAVMKQPGRE